MSPESTLKFCEIGIEKLDIFFTLDVPTFFNVKQYVDEVDNLTDKCKKCLKAILYPSYWEKFKKLFPLSSTGEKLEEEVLEIIQELLKKYNLLEGGK